MRCIHCAREVPAGRFCLSCGQPLDAGAPIATPSNPPAAPRTGTPRRPVLTLILCLIALLGLLSVVGVAILMRGNNVAAARRSGAGTAPGPVVVLPDRDIKPTPPVVVQPGLVDNVPSPVVVPPTPPSPGMPDDVRAYLERLQKIEILRLNEEDRFGRQVPQFLTGMMEWALSITEEDQAGQAKMQQMLGTFRQGEEAAHQVGARFESETPPVPDVCQRLHLTYRAAMQSWSATIGQISRALVQGLAQQTPPDPKALGRQGSGAYEERLREAEGELTAICARYNVRPWFHIEPVPRGGILGF
ncbi:MAG: hypothetical protein HY320_01400 [Armatimonadetes bacterium]|nr:hypothetical protein [Armatimonadota bacterium]